MRSMNHTFKKLTTENCNDKDWPLALETIPNRMGINLCAVDGMSWTRQIDGQPVDLTIHFIPAAPDRSEFNVTGKSFTVPQNVVAEENEQ